MTTPPPPVPPPTPPPATPAARVVLVVESAPRALTAQPPNTIIQAEVTQAVPRGGTVVLHSDLGLLTARTPVALPAGATVSLQIQSAPEPQALLRLVAVNGRAPLAGSGGPSAGFPSPGAGAGGLAAGGLSGPGGAGSSAATGPAATVVSPAGAPGRGALTATIVRAPAAPAGATPPGASPGQPGPVGGGGPTGAMTVGTRLTVTVTGIQPPVSGAGAAPPGAFAASAAGTGSASTGGSAAQGRANASIQNAAGAPGTKAGTAVGGPARGGVLGSLAAGFGARPGVQGLQTGAAGGNPATGIGPAGPAGGPSALGGTVLAGGAPAATLLRTPVGTVALPVRLDAPTGSTVTLAVSRVEPAPPGGADGIRPLTPLNGGRGWPTLTQAIQTLARADLTAARALDATIPRPGPHLAAAMISLTGSLRAGGDTRQWPGAGSMRALEQAGPAGARLAAALKEDVGALAGRARDGAGGDWRAYTLPFADQAEISPIRLIVGPRGGGDQAGQDGADDGASGNGDGQRFLIDVSLSALGRVQIDGLMNAPQSRLRLLIRTAQPLPDSLRADLLRLTEGSLSALGLQGALTFQGDGRFVEPLPDDDETAAGPAGAPPPGGVIA